MKRIAAVLLSLAAFGLAGPVTAQYDDDRWFEDDTYGTEYEVDYGYYDDFDEYGYQYEAEDEFGYYDEDYDWGTDENWFDDWYGDADQDWDWF